MNVPILVATDLSAPSRHAVDRAWQLAAHLNQSLHLLHVTPPGLLDSLSGFLGQSAGPVAESLEADLRRQLQAWIDDPRHPAGVVASWEVISGTPVTVIGEQADTLGVPLLVLGSRGEGFLHQWALGSTASRVLRKTRRPVLVVKQVAHVPYQRALVAMDFSPAARAALRQVRRLQPEVELVLVHAVELPFEGKMQHANVDPDIIQRYRIQGQTDGQQRLRELADAEGLPASTRLLALHGNVTSVLLEQEQAEDCDLIVLGKHGRHPIAEWLLGSTTKHVLSECQADVLVVDEDASEAWSALGL